MSQTFRTFIKDHPNMSFLDEKLGWMNAENLLNLHGRQGKFHVVLEGAIGNSLSKTTATLRVVNGNRSPKVYHVIE